MRESFAKISMWAGSMAWHLWRIATGRPEYTRLSDTKFMLWSFIGVYFFAGVLRWTYGTTHVNAIAISAALVGNLTVLILYAVLLRLALTHKKMSKVLFAVALGVSAAVDFVVVALLAIFGSGGALTGISFYSNLFTIVMTAYIIFRFFRLPSSMKAAGFKARALLR